MTDPLRARLEHAKAAIEEWIDSPEGNANELVCEVLQPAIEAALRAAPAGDDLTSLRDECEHMLRYASPLEAPAWRQIAASIAQKIAARAAAPEETP